MTSENILSGLHQLKDACTSVHLAGIPIGCRSKKHHSICSTVQALRGVCPKGYQSIRGLCGLNLHCLTSAGKVPFQ